MMSINILKGEKDIRRFPAGTTIFSTGAPPDGMYAVIDGSIDILVDGHVRETVAPGGLFGELALLDDQPRSATAVARVDSTVAVVDARRFETLVQRLPFFALDVMRVMAERLRRRS